MACAKYHRVDMIFRKLTFFALTLSLLSGCDFFQQEQEQQKPKVSSAESAIKPQDMNQLVNYFSLNAYEQFSKAAIEAENLDHSIALLIRNPKPETFEVVKKQWRTAYNSYLNAQPYYYLPIKDPTEWVQKRIGYKNLVANIDSYPIEGGYVDYLADYPFSGIVNDLAININEQTLIDQHGLADPSSASLGFHVLEFLLWGQEGKREVSDYYPQKNQQEAHNIDTGENAKNPAYNSEQKIQNRPRRRAMLKLVSEKLYKDINHIKNRWEISNGFYAVTLADSTSPRVLAAILQSSQHLLEQELLAKRLREDSSAFSQTTADDVRAVIAGMLKIYDLGSDEIKEQASSDSQPHNTGLLLSANKQLAKTWEKETAILIGLVDAWQKSRTQADKARVIEQTIQVLQLVYNIADSFGIKLKKPKPKV